MKLLKFLIFNRLVKGYLYKNPFIGFGLNKRLSAISSELLYCLAVFLPFWIILMIPSFILQEPFHTDFTYLDLLAVIPFSLMMIVLFNKDFFNGQSVVKRHIGYQVIDINTTQPANHFKCMLRNITAPLWPIEVVFTLFNKQRRLGDFLARTKVIEVPPSDPKEILLEIKNKSFDKSSTLTLIVSIVVALLYTVLVDPKLGFL